MKSCLIGRSVSSAKNALMLMSRTRKEEGKRNLFKRRLDAPSDEPSMLIPDNNISGRRPERSVPMKKAE